MKLNRIFNRRKFIVDSLLASAGLSLLPVVSKGDFSLTSDQIDEGALSDLDLDPIVPIQYFDGYQAELVQYLREIRSNFGIRRFLVVGPSKEYRYQGFPGKAVFEHIGNIISQLKSELVVNDIEIGWWCTTTIRIGKGPFQQIIKSDGEPVRDAICPFDPQFRETFSDYVGAVVEIAKPFWINFEDDFHLNGGCFCPECIARFAEKNGVRLSREEIVRNLSFRGEDANRFRERWLSIGRESLVGLARVIRGKVDFLAPSTRLCLCQSGNSERDGDFTEQVTLALAGQTRPAVRVFGTSYFSDNPLDIPIRIFNALYQRQHLPREVEMIHESDTFPHTRFFMSSKKLNSLMMAGFTYGLDGSLFYATQYLENPLEETGYFDMFKKEHKRFNRVISEVKQCSVQGCQIFRYPRQSSNWVQIIGRLGLPYTTTEANVKLVTGDNIIDMSDTALKDLLKGNLLLDGSAAAVIQERKLEYLIGASVRRPEYDVPPFYEGVRDPESFNLGNRLMYNYVWAFGNDENSFYQLDPHDKAIVLTDLMNSKNQSISAGMLLFRNELGGRVATIAYNVNDSYVNSRSISMFNYSKKQLIRYAIEWVGKEQVPVFVSSLPNVFCIYTKSWSKKYCIITLIGLSADDYPETAIDFSHEWLESRVFLLDKDGEWESLDISHYGTTTKLPIRLSSMRPMILKVEKMI